MSNALTLTPSDINLPQAAVERQIPPATWSAMKNALYPGKSDQMVLLAFDYCKARGLDPVKKPIHIVNTWDADQGKSVETIWEGINSHRVTASRTREYAGQDEPEFGPDVTRAVGSCQMTFPAWCKVTVYRLVGGHRCSFTGLVRWMEAYSQKKGGDPTAMWRKRPYSQLAKCAEAEALRKAFPEELGGRPTAEEMDGQWIEEIIEPAPTQRQAASRLDAIETIIDAGSSPLPATSAAPAVNPSNERRDDPSAQTDGAAQTLNPWLAGSETQTKTHRIPLVSPVSAMTRYFGTVSSWCDAIDLLLTDEFDSPADVWDQNNVTHVRLMQAAKTDAAQARLKAVADAAFKAIKAAAVVEGQGA